DSGYDWLALQALGSPNTLDYGEHGTAWSPASENRTTEWLSVGFDQPDYATGVLIRETYGNGFVTKVELLDTSNAYHTVWEKSESVSDTSERGQPVNFVVTFSATAYQVDGVRITLDTGNSKDDAFEEIDAVKLLG